MYCRIVEYVRSLRGGSHPYLTRSLDGSYWVVKLQGNAQGDGILVNELAANRLARTLGLPVPAIEIVRLDPDVLELIRLSTPEHRNVCAGPHIGIKVPVSSLEGRTYEQLPSGSRLSNPEAISGAAVFDEWTANTDRRQYIFWRYCREKSYSALLIDNGYCFGGNEWRIDRVPVSILPNSFDELKGQRRLADTKEVRQCVEDWIGKTAQLSGSDYESAFYGIPPEWYQGRGVELGRLPRQLAVRSEKLCRQIEQPIYIENELTSQEILRA